MWRFGGELPSAEGGALTQGAILELNSAGSPGILGDMNFRILIGALGLAAGAAAAEETVWYDASGEVVAVEETTAAPEVFVPQWVARESDRARRESMGGTNRWRGGSWWPAYGWGWGGGPVWGPAPVWSGRPWGWSVNPGWGYRRHCDLPRFGGVSVRITID